MNIEDQSLSLISASPESILQENGTGRDKILSLRDRICGIFVICELKEIGLGAISNGLFMPKVCQLWLFGGIDKLTQWSTLWRFQLVKIKNLQNICLSQLHENIFSQKSSMSHDFSDTHVHVFQNCSQDNTTVSSIMEHAVKYIKKEHLISQKCSTQVTMQDAITTQKLLVIFHSLTCLALTLLNLTI